MANLQVHIKRLTLPPVEQGRSLGGGRWLHLLRLEFYVPTGERMTAGGAMAIKIRIPEVENWKVLGWCLFDSLGLAGQEMTWSSYVMWECVLPFLTQWADATMEEMVVPPALGEGYLPLWQKYSAAGGVIWRDVDHKPDEFCYRFVGDNAQGKIPDLFPGGAELWWEGRGAEVDGDVDGFAQVWLMLSRAVNIDTNKTEWTAPQKG